MANFPNDDRLVYSVEEAAEILGIGRNTAYNSINSGEIPSVRIGRSIRVPKAALQELLEKMPEEKPKQESESDQTIVRLRMPPKVKSKPEPRVQLGIQIPVVLNNKLVQSAIANDVSLTQEIVSR